MVFTKKIKNGFTLIEVLLAVSVISFLSSITLYSTTEARKKSEDANMKVEVNQVKTAVELYKQDHNSNAPGYDNSSMTNRILKEGSVDNDDYETVMEELVPKYMSEVPTSPSGTSYSYLVTEDGKNAMFAASLNFTYGGYQNNNSCDFVTGGSGEDYLADIDNDGDVDSDDLEAFEASFYSSEGDPDYNPDADLNGDGIVNTLDYALFLSSESEYENNSQEAGNSPDGICTGSITNDYCSCS